MPRIVEEQVYSFSELSDRAKESAREWYRSGALDYEWWESVYDDAAKCGKLIGIDLNQKPVKLMNGSTRYDPAIYFSGFSSQGDGACFESQYAYVKGAAKAIREHAPNDARLHEIADGLQDVQRRNMYRLEARTVHRGHYYHEHCMNVDVSRSDDATVSEACESVVTDLLRDFARWIYRQLETEHDYLMSDEQVDESILANEYDFNEDGTRY